MKLNAKQIDIINAHTLAVYPEEAVIAITKRSAYPLKNIHADPCNHFKVDARQFYKLKAVALVHSHPVDVKNPPIVTITGHYVDPRTPSKADMQTQINMDIPFGIVSTDGVEVAAPFWFPDLDTNVMGKEYVSGINDCYSLVRAYYKQTYNIIIPEYPRNYDWWNEQPDAYVKLYEKYGFVEIQEHELEVGDGMLIRMGKHEGHAAIYSAPDTILHHINNRLSGVDSFQKWRPAVTRFLRHKDKPRNE
jgi:proteasome lid subunit RPN8/RPN11